MKNFFNRYILKIKKEKRCIIIAKEKSTKPKKSYCIINDKNQQITFVADKITKKEQETIRKLISIGYKANRITTEELYPKKKIYTKENVLKFLKTKGGELEKKFNSIQEEPVIDNLTGTVKIYNNGKTRKKGYIAALKWFREEYKKEFLEFIEK